jgi:transcriptional regulator with XRE-family HTH domain
MTATITTKLTPEELDAIEREAKERRAQERLVKVDDTLAAIRMVKAGMAHRAIAARLGLSNATVSRYANRSQVTVDRMRVEQMILRAFVDHTPRERLIDELVVYNDYTFTQHDPDGIDNAIGGSWGELTIAQGLGYMTWDEVNRVAARKGLRIYA